MNSFVHEAKTLEKAIKEAQNLAKNPKKFCIKILDSGICSLLWWNNRPAKILFSYNFLENEAPKQYTEKQSQKIKRYKDPAQYNKNNNFSAQGRKKTVANTKSTSLKQPLTNQKIAYEKSKPESKQPLKNDANAFAFNVDKTHKVNTSTHIPEKNLTNSLSNKKTSPSFSNSNTKETEKVSQKKPLSTWNNKLVALTQKHVFEIAKNFKLINQMSSPLSSIEENVLTINLGPAILEDETRNKHISSSIAIIVIDLLKKSTKEDLQNLKLIVKYDQ